MSEPIDDPPAWKVLGSRVVLQRKYFRLREDHVRTPSGAEIVDYTVSENPPWVLVVAITRSDEVVLVRQYRHGIGAVHTELPGGVSDPGASDLEAEARRELREETGYGGGRWTHLLDLAPNPANQSNLAHVWLAQDVERQGDAQPEDTEDLRVLHVPASGLEAEIASGRISQALAVAGLCRYLLTRR